MNVNERIYVLVNVGDNMDAMIVIWMNEKGRLGYIWDYIYILSHTNNVIKNELIIISIDIIISEKGHKCTLN